MDLTALSEVCREQKLQDETNLARQTQQRLEQALQELREEHHHNEELWKGQEKNLHAQVELQRQAALTTTANQISPLLSLPLQIIETQQKKMLFATRAIRWFQQELQHGAAAQAPTFGSVANPIDVDDAATNKELNELHYWEKHERLKRHYKLIEAMVHCPPPPDMPKEDAVSCHCLYVRMMKQLEETPETHPAGKHGPYSGLEEIELVIDHFAGRSKEAKNAALLRAQRKALSDILTMVGENKLANAAAQIAVLPDAKPWWHGLKLMTVDILMRDGELAFELVRVLGKDLNHAQATSEEKHLWQAIMKSLVPVANTDRVQTAMKRRSASLAATAAAKRVKK